MEMRFLKHGELEDQKIMEALLQAAKDFENGAIAEARDTLIEIANAIDEFENIMS